MRISILLLVAALAAAAAPPEYKAGIGRVEITPAGPIWMSGYASRTKPSEGVLQKLWAKALAVQDRRGTKLVIVTTDLIGLPRSISDAVGARVEKQYGISRGNLLLNSSHTHTGPLIRKNLEVMVALDQLNRRVVDDYSTKLTDQLVDVVGSAVGAMKPASLSWGQGKAGFAMNRREKTASGVKIGLNPNGPMDHSVPVVRVADAEGKTLALLFGYACHNTTLTGEHYQISGDFAGYAQADVEAAQPGVTAMFIQLCAGDQNPNPRSEVKYAEQHGRELSGAVQGVARGTMKPMKGHLAGTLQWKDLPVQPTAREDFEKMLSDSQPVRVRFAQEMLRRLDARDSLRTVAYPVQALRLGDGLVLVALGGETVVEYALRIKAAHPKLGVIVSAYSNDVMGYIPTAKMLEEGGYEPVGSTMYYGQAAPFAPEIEKIILDSAAAAIARVKP
ncbi:MAG: neutral/alkaline non-lysosomal ceramidase N-terminal domain-containing protein [Bryobacteraceae bacterium]|nr:neutral/alkaline non-lysosomal ceramidase N-terminal domain-containing protein [Bryobacteraceae bacterium]